MKRNQFRGDFRNKDIFEKLIKDSDWLRELEDLYENQ